MREGGRRKGEGGATRRGREKGRRQSKGKNMLDEGLTRNMRKVSEREGGGRVSQRRKKGFAMSITECFFSSKYARSEGGVAWTMRDYHSYIRLHYAWLSETGRKSGLGLVRLGHMKFSKSS